MVCRHPRSNDKKKGNNFSILRIRFLRFNFDLTERLFRRIIFQNVTKMKNETDRKKNPFKFAKDFQMDVLRYIEENENFK